VLSIITPAYNVEPYLGACIESVLGQTLRDLELIVVDDGSTDGTASVIAAYAARDPRIRGFRGPNRGVSHARNVAMRHARGRYFALLDGDDTMDPACAATLVRLLERQPQVSVVSGNALFEGGGVLHGRPVRPWPAESREITFLDMIEDEASVFIMSILRREVFEAVGGFDERLHRSEDYDFWLRAAASGVRFISHPQPLGRYRRRDDSLTADQSAMYESMMGVLARARGFRHRARPEELGAIDRQLERLQSDYLLTKGKAAMLRRQFVESSYHFWALFRRERRLVHGATALGLRIAPSAVLAAYRSRLSTLTARGGPGAAQVARPAEFGASATSESSS
jgi:glycosyltransferase involved in cell wall biosynthesis